jgi:hypothetical protein
MHRKTWSLFTGLCGLFTVAALTTTVRAQEVKPKPPMYSYVAQWQVPRDKWPDLEKSSGALMSVLEKSAADGTLVGYGHDESVVHSSDGATHDNWWAAKSMGALVKVLEQVRTNASVTSSAMSVATKHWDNIYVSRYYNWKTGPYKNAYGHVSLYKFKSSAPDDALDQLSQHLIVPVMEKLLADGTIIEYEVDTEAIHSEDPSEFSLVYLSPTPEGLDKALAAVQETVKAHPLAGQAFGAATDDTGHRDFLLKGDGAYK